MLGQQHRQQPHSRELQELNETMPSGTSLMPLDNPNAPIRILLSQDKRLVLTAHLHDAYPREPPAFHLTSPHLHPDLLDKLRQTADKEAATHLGSPHLLPVVRLLHRLVATNKCLPAWDEIRDAKEALKDVMTLKLAEVQGRISATLRSGAYEAKLQLTLPADYPAEPPALVVCSHNFDPSVEVIYVNRAREVMRRLAEGHAGVATPDQGESDEPAAAAAAAAEGKLPPGARAERLNKELKKGKSTEPTPDLSSQGVAELRGDREFLAQYATVRDYEQRRTRRILVHHKRKEDMVLEEEKREAARATESGRQPRKSLLAGLKVLALEWVQGMPVEPCQICGKRVLPPAPPKEGTAPAAEAVRSLCGHWVHVACVDPLMNAPPFSSDCPACGQPIRHPRWRQKKLREKRWAFEQAREREISDVSEFLDLM